MFNLDAVINQYVTKRSSSMFLQDIEENRADLSERIFGKTVLGIGGAGSIGSSYIKALLLRWLSWILMRTVWLN